MALIKKVFKKVYLYGEMVMFSHTLFSLPFALITLFLAAKGFPSLSILFFSLLALVAGRTGANAFNRYADRFIDKQNPRTANRHIPKGILKASEALAVTIISYLIYFYAAYNINEICLYFSIVPILFFTVYPYTKRFTALCHLFLGLACGLAVFGAWMAVKNELLFLFIRENRLVIDFTQINIVPILLFIAVMLWNAGFDIIYGTQDIQHDQTHHIFSIPAKLGLKKALLVSKLFHFTMIVLLVSLVYFTELSTLFLIGVLLVSGIFLVEHRIIKPTNPVVMKLASYKLNQVISMTLLLFSILDLFLM